jgi:hypothetical protein
VAYTWSASSVSDTTRYVLYLKMTAYVRIRPHTLAYVRIVCVILLDMSYI